MQRNFSAVGKLVLLLSVLFLSGPVFAQASRTWVSGVGDDANPCSRTAPCKTFAGAISKTAASGEISVLDPGGYGGVTITKSITIDGAGTLASILVSGTNGVIVNGAGAKVILRNLSINGFSAGLNGVRFINGASLNVENVSIFGFTQYGIDFTPSATAELVVNNSTIENNQVAGFGGVHIKPGAGASAMASLDGVRLLNNNFGLRIEDRTTANISHCVVSGSANNGVLAVTAAESAELTVDNCLISNNGSLASYAGVKSNGILSTVNISNNTITNNSTGILSESSGAIVSLGNNSVAGNGADGSPTSTVSTR